MRGTHLMWDLAPSLTGTGYQQGPLSTPPVDAFESTIHEVPYFPDVVVGRGRIACEDTITGASATVVTAPYSRTPGAPSRDDSQSVSIAPPNTWY